MQPAEPVQPTEANDSPVWRDEVASRLSSYRAKRNPKAKDASMQLDFGPTAPREPKAPSRSRKGGNIGTDFYRKMNAEVMAAAAAPPPPPAPAPASSGAAAAAAPAPAPDFDLHAEPDPDFDLDALRTHRAEDIIAATDEPMIAMEPEIEPEPEPVAIIEEPPARPAPQTNVIVFPRPILEPPLAVAPSREELAEPVSRRPRILDVPEENLPSIQGSLFPEIHLDSAEHEVSARQEPKIEVPLKVAPVSQRFAAGVIDWVLVAVASGIFAGIAIAALPDVPHTKPFWGILGVVPIVFWAVYQHMFLLYSGRTLGMQSCRIRLSTFDGRTPAWLDRKRRARYAVVSFISMTLGLLWAFVDEDALCWHDRITHTFPTAE